MPILAAETSLYPENLLSESTAQETTERFWWVVHTKPRQEKALARQLCGYEIPFFLPLIPKENLIRGKRVRSRLPLFSSYVFLFADEKERVRSLTTNRISYLLPVVDQGRLERDLRQFNQLIAADAPLTVESRLQPGQRVRIKTGSFQGMEGTLLSRRGQSRLLVTVDYLLQGASVEIDDYQLEPL